MNRKVECHLLPLRSIMTTDVRYAYPNTSIFDAIQLLLKNKISGLPVVTPDMEIVGILTEKDVLNILMKERIAYDETVADYMSTEVVTFQEEDSAVEVCQFFRNNPIRRVPVTRDGKLIGIVSRRDIIALILEAENHFASYRFS